MKKRIMMGFVFSILLLNIITVSASLGQLPSSEFRIKLDPADNYCWKCTDYYPMVSKLSPGKLCVDDNSNVLLSTIQIQGMISKAESLTSLSNDLYKQKIIGCHMIYLKDHMETGATLIDPDNNGVLSKTDTIKGTITKEIKWDLGGKVTVLYPGTAIEYQNGIWTVTPGNDVANNEKSYFLFDNKKFVSASEQTFTISRLSGAWTATPDTSIPRVNLASVVNDFFRRLGGLFA